LRIVDVLRVEGAASRADIARRTGLSRTTVSTLVGALLERGLVVERQGEARVARNGQIGRPPILLTLDPSAAAAVGVDFDHDKVRVAVSDLSRTVLAEAVVPCDVDADAAAAIELAGQLVDELLDESGVVRSRLLGAGVALAGPVDHDTGTLHRSAVLAGWDVDAAQVLTERLGMSVHIDNDANLGALAEVTFGAATEARFAAYVTISSGIGAGLVADGRPFRGHRGLAGEIGHLLVDSSGPICRCGNRGCLETVASCPALLSLIQATRPEVGSIPELIDLARDGDMGCRRVLADAGMAIGGALASLVSLLGPDTVVVGGVLSEAGDLLLDPLREAITRYAMPSSTQDLMIVPGALGDRANLLGALALVITQSDHAVAARIAEAVAG
jgi:predicted NBD/HSP70 family sugar kinase